MPADQSTREREECLVYVGPSFVANAQPSELIQPGEGSFYDPPPSAQSAPSVEAKMKYRKDFDQKTRI